MKTLAAPGSHLDRGHYLSGKFKRLLSLLGHPKINSENGIYHAVQQRQSCDESTCDKDERETGKRLWEDEESDSDTSFSQQSVAIQKSPWRDLWTQTVVFTLIQQALFDFHMG